MLLEGKQASAQKGKRLIVKLTCATQVVLNLKITLQFSAGLFRSHTRAHLDSSNLVKSHSIKAHEVPTVFNLSLFRLHRAPEPKSTFGRTSGGFWETNCRV